MTAISRSPTYGAVDIGFQSIETLNQHLRLIVLIYIITEKRGLG
jgi:hypothetical protein